MGYIDKEEMDVCDYIERENPLLWKRLVKSAIVPFKVARMILRYSKEKDERIKELENQVKELKEGIDKLCNGNNPPQKGVWSTVISLLPKQEQNKN
ncbi:MAG: hypothetical protein ACI9AT_000425 [Ulvibacter sp.]|jgi:hypothetical protein